MKPAPRACTGAARPPGPLQRSVLKRGKATLTTYMGPGTSHPTMVLCQVESLGDRDLAPLEKLQTFCSRRGVLFAVVAPGEASLPMAETLQRWGIMVFLQPPTEAEVEAFVRLQRLLRNPAVWA
ncbi:hypothetical protein [Cupriavidus sp. AU9028]|uniref:hypothetical protein n=1 Tax=Cupriavidus sp. AU9028 TaxID=2871157 RepID=UPI001C944839|nr:hypothetical protein [Cupriavidus sp. AU9028]MBY4895515.1 hypothetical protein [Cupriavidus sp. AU9028]